MEDNTDKEESLKHIHPTDDQRALFRRGHIRDVLNPTITNPFYNVSHAIKLNKDQGWISMDVALLKTRKKDRYQFLIIFLTLTNVQNSTFHPITLNFPRQGLILNEEARRQVEIKSDSNLDLGQVNLISTFE
jgi:hypothetical protein